MMMLTLIQSLLPLHQLGMEAEFLRVRVTTDILFHPNSQILCGVSAAAHLIFGHLDILPAVAAGILSFMVERHFKSN